MRYGTEDPAAKAADDASVTHMFGGGDEGPRNDDGPRMGNAEAEDLNKGALAEQPTAKSYTNPPGEASENALSAEAFDLPDGPLDMRALAVELTKGSLSPTPLVQNGKAAFLPEFNTRATNDPAKVFDLFSDALGSPRECNIGIVNGAPLSDGWDLFTIDLDTKASKDGKAAAATLNERYKQLEGAIGVALPKTVMVRTVTPQEKAPSRGAHLLFKAPRGTFRGAELNFLPQIEIPIQSVAPGSTIDGRAYEWESGRAPGQCDIAEAPRELLDAYLAARGPRVKASAAERLNGDSKPPKPAYEPDRPADIEAMRQWLRDPGPNGAPHAGDGRSGTGRVINLAFLKFNPLPDTLCDVLMESGGWNETKTKTPWALDGDDGGADGNIEKYVYDQYADLKEAPGSHKRVATDDVLDAVDGVGAPTPEQKERMEKAAKDAAEAWPEPMPLPDALAPVAPFDPAFLPDSIAPWVADIAERMQCPPDYVAIAALVALGSVLGRKAAIRPQRKGSWHEHANLWGVVVGDPGVEENARDGRSDGPAQGTGRKGVGGRRRGARAVSAQAEGL